MYRVELGIIQITLKNPVPICSCRPFQKCCPCLSFSVTMTSTNSSGYTAEYLCQMKAFTDDGSAKAVTQTQIHCVV